LSFISLLPLACLSCVADGEPLAGHRAHGDRELSRIDPSQLRDVAGHRARPDRQQLVVHPGDVGGQRGEVGHREVALDRAPDQAAVVLGEGFELREADLPGSAVGTGQAG
jgi:hypothetical protein